MRKRSASARERRRPRSRRKLLFLRSMQLRQPPSRMSVRIESGSGSVRSSGCWKMRSRRCQSRMGRIGTAIAEVVMKGRPGTR
eukprot:27958-Eustigmatos_ZCMA.PRE.1